MKKDSLVKNFKSLWMIMSNKERKKSCLFIFFILIQTMLEAISIGSLYPMLLSIFSKDAKLFNNELFNLDLFKKFIIGNNELLIISIMIVFIFFIKNSFMIFLVHWSQTFERNIKIRLKDYLLQYYIYQDYSFHTNTDSSKLVRNINTATNTIMQSIRSSMMLTNDVSLFICLMLFMMTINLQFVLYSAAIMIVLSSIYFFFFKRILIRYGKFSFKHEGDSLKRLLQAFAMIKEIKLFNKENYFINFFNKEEKLFQEFQRKATIIRTYPRFFFEIIFISGILIFINIKIFNSQESISEILPKTALLVVILIRIIPGLNRIINSIQKLNQYQKSNDEIIDELIYQNLEKDMTNENNSDLEEKYKFNKINLKNVSFKYSEKEKFIFEKINLEIKKGSYLGIIGGSGSGKSTLIDLITGLLNINKGSIEINDESADIKHIKWKNLFGYVPQQTNLFNDTIFANITFENDINKINKTKLNEAIVKSGLKLFVENLSDGISTSVGEWGYKISGGEKQRISIARALYKDPEILIFDESFNSLDRETKKNILGEIKGLLESKTIIMISHIVDDLKDCSATLDLSKKN